MDLNSDKNNLKFRMEDVAGGTDDKDDVPLNMDGHENLVARATKVLKNEGDDKVLESVVELLEDLEINAGMREALKNYQKYGWAFILRTTKPDNDFKPQDTLTSSTMVADSEEARPDLDSGVDYENDPIENELVMKTIFEFCSVDDLRNCRLVCKKWHDLSLSSWRGRAVVVIDNLFKDTVDKYNEYISSNQLRPTDFFDREDEDTMVREFIKIGSSLEIPFRRYHMKFNTRGWFFPDDFKVKEITMMMDLFGSSIQQLSIKCDDLNTIYLLLTKLPQLRVLNLEVNCRNLFLDYESIITDGRNFPLRDLQLPTMTKLRELELNIFPHYQHPEEIDVTLEDFPWKQIFKSAPNLKSFHLNSEECDTAFEETMNSFYQVRRDGDFSTLNLKDLYITQASCRLVRRVVECQCALQTICINMEDGMDHDNIPSTISALLEGHAETLEYINFGKEWFSSYNRRALAPYLPLKIKLPILKELVLRNDCVWGFHLLSSLDLPNLEILRISSQKYIETAVL